MSSPLASPRKRVDHNLEPKDFQAKLDRIVKAQNQILKLASQVYSLGKTQKLSYPNGKQLGRKELKSLSAQLGKEIKSLKKNYVDHGKRKKRTRREGTVAGFKNPIIVSENMINFFRTANLGQGITGVPTFNHEGKIVALADRRSLGSLNQLLAVSTNGITTRAIMTPLFNIYAHVNNMQQDPTNHQFLAATTDMYKYFSQTFASLSARPAKMSKPDKNGVRKPIPQFDPKHFRYASIQSIVAENTRPKESLSEEEKAYLATPEVAQRLEQEQAIVSQTLFTYREGKEAAKKAAKRR